MASLDSEYLKTLSFTGEQAGALRRLGEARGRQQVFLQQAPQQLEALRQSAVIESTESSNRIEGVTAADGRVADLVARDAVPRDRSEQEIAGYRDALQLIHDSHADMPFTPNVILQLHSILFRYLHGEGGHWKPTDNSIVERDAQGRTVRVRFAAVPAVATPHAMDELTAGYHRITRGGETDALVLIPLTVLDLLCTHPFRDGNGRMARLLTLLLLYRAEYRVGRYISLERLVEESKETYYDALALSSQGWHDSRHDARPWLDYFWGVLIRAYGEFETRIETLKGSKTDQIREAVWRRTGPFSISDVEGDCPGVSRDMVRHVLRQMKGEQLIAPTGVGRSARWRRLQADDAGVSHHQPSVIRRGVNVLERGPAIRFAQSADQQLRLAIADKRLIEFRYHGSLRTGEPHDYGIQNGIPRVLVYQLRGPVRSQRRSVTGWRLLDVAKVEDCVVLDDTFPGSRGQVHRQHLLWDIVYARVS